MVRSSQSSFVVSWLNGRSPSTCASIGSIGRYLPPAHVPALLRQLRLSLRVCSAVLHSQSAMFSTAWTVHPDRQRLAEVFAFRRSHGRAVKLHTSSMLIIFPAPKEGDQIRISVTIKSGGQCTSRKGRARPRGRAGAENRREGEMLEAREAREVGKGARER